jgi:hypothetical protein
LLPRASDILAVRIRAIDDKVLSPARSAALPAATGLSSPSYCACPAHHQVACATVRCAGWQLEAACLEIEGFVTRLSIGVSKERRERLSIAPSHDRGHEPAQPPTAHRAPRTITSTKGSRSKGRIRHTGLPIRRNVLSLPQAYRVLAFGGRPTCTQLRSSQSAEPLIITHRDCSEVRYFNVWNSYFTTAALCSWLGRH